jgi:FkbM family methyltransferase
MSLPLHRLRRAVLRAIDRPQTYRLGGIDLLLTPDHLLPVHQAQNPLYDRFLPHLAGRLAAGDLIIDVGANCGDTLAGMLERQGAASYLCVEADPGFFALLERNAAALRAAHPKATIHLVPALAGTPSTAGTLVGKGGTMTLSVAATAPGTEPVENAARPLDAIAATSFDAAALADTARTLLVKSDVDGFDHDVILSAGTLLDRPNTMLFYEVHCTRDFQVPAYERLFEQLEARGFAHAWVFDNVGNPMFCATSAAQLASLTRSLWRQQRGLSRRSFAYFDVLACNAAALDAARAAVSSFEAAIESGAGRVDG